MIFKHWDELEDEKWNQISTDRLMNQIKEAPEQFAEKKLALIEDVRFEDYLNDLMGKYHCTAGQLIIRTCLSKPFVYQIMKGERVPGRDVILRISLAMKANVDETQHLLTLAEKGILYPKVKRDAAILCCIELHKSLEYTNAFLEKHGEKSLL